jgi:hypothetical protein
MCAGVRQCCWLSNVRAWHDVNVLSVYFVRFGMAPNRVEGDMEEMTHLNVYQASKRGGTMQVALLGGNEGKDPAKLVIAGHCVTIMQSTLTIPVE